MLAVRCGVASFNGFLFDKDALTMSFAPKDEHEAQVQFALERGIPAVSAVMGTKRLSFPSNVFDVVHCARCRVRRPSSPLFDPLHNPDHAPPWLVDMHFNRTANEQVELNLQLMHRQLVTNQRHQRAGGVSGSHK
ncbi:hypothetical protein ACP4OV_023449 [Aristida adscensionis]